MTISSESFSGMSAASVVSDSLNITIARGLKLFITVPLFGGGLFISIFSVANFIPQMTEKGSIDLLLSKPVSRAQIILGKFFGGTVMVFVNIAYLVIGLWILIGFKFGDWDPSFLLTIFTITFAFALLYALVILTGIITKSSVISMIVSYLIFFIFSPVLANRESIFSFFGSSVLEFVGEFLHYIIPQTSELSTITSDLATGKGLLSVEPIVTSFVLLIVFLTVSIMIFNKKDY
ncbi:MAG: ABC transporter permease subunit [Chlorobi bacterium]|nr:ABC transporter permease subunit [Chlorobiota bacterium]